MKMKNWLLGLIALFYLIGCEKENPDNKIAERPPNVVFILSDDQGWGDLSLSGNKNLSTPNIDGLGKNGVVFNHFYVSPVCSPTRAEILTGRYAVRGGVYSTSAGGERLDLDEVTIADYFKEAGYATACYGKWHNGMQYPYHPNGRGFDDYYGFCSGHWGDYYDPMLERNGQIVKGEDFIIDDFTNKGISFIEQNKDQPFFLYLPFNTPHAPMQVPDKWWNKFKNKELTSLYYDADKEDIDFTRAALAMCENIDWNVGRIMETLQKNGLEENTIVIYLSDNGPNGYRWNCGMKGKKGDTDEGGVRSPLEMQWKDQLDAGKVVENVASSLDFLPTLLDMAGIKAQFKNTLDGNSLKPLLFAEEQVDTDFTNRNIISHWAGKTSIRNQKYRLDAENRLYNMEVDPGQTTNIAESSVEVFDELKTIKSNWETEVLTELSEVDTRTFTVGHPDYNWYQLPARDALATGNIIRSNRWPNCSYYTNWVSTTDSIYFEIEVLEEADFEVIVYYTCKEKDTGVKMDLSFKNAILDFQINDANDPPLEGESDDRYLRKVSLVKDFKPLNIGKIHLKKGIGNLVLKATEIPRKNGIDFRLLMLKKAS
ncbi:arylsulfatase [Chondrinema litorale]|uniref:arylsulfatase n=1 Tax=Chondrinema litorale TaxID=2994555 RepID=UPI002542C3B9|nr:arylsulfatase [Chondrinema litorale]UZR98056.1 arylsulfatase [Chondrinema litorale]